MPSVGYLDSLNIIKELVARVHAAGQPISPTIVLVGGNALAFHGIRKMSEDVDAFIASFPPQVVEELEADLQKVFGPLFKLDVTPTENLWGNFLIRDIEQNSCLAEIFEVGGQTYQVRALTIEDLLIAKLDSERQKDKNDLAGLARHTTADALIARFNKLVLWYGNRDGVPAYTERFVELLANQYGRPPAEIIPQLNITSGVKQMLSDAFLGDDEGQRP